jgi:hypothetical protein
MCKRGRTCKLSACAHEEMNGVFISSRMRTARVMRCRMRRPAYRHSGACGTKGKHPCQLLACKLLLAALQLRC